MATVKILDASTLFFDYHALRPVEKGEHILLPFGVVETLRDKSSGRYEQARNSREALSVLGKLALKGDTFKGVPYGKGTVKLVRSSAEELSLCMKKYHIAHKDAEVLCIALSSMQKYDSIELFTRDSILLVQASRLKLPVRFYQRLAFQAEELYPGYRALSVEEELFEKVLKREFALCDERDFQANEYLLLTSENEQVFARYDGKRKGLVPLDPASEEVPRWIRALNAEQQLALDALLNDEISLVTLIGKAGTGKTLLAIAAGLYKTVDGALYERVLVSRPTLPLGQDIGFLPGSVEEKLTPWMYPIADNVDYILRKKKSARSRLQSFSDLTDKGILLIEPLAYIRGRSIHQQFLIVDEAQNLTSHEIKTILTRAGEGTKIVLAGDPYQIDNPEINSSTSGLMQVVDKFKGQHIAAHITLTEGVRSELSELAAHLL